MQLHNTCCRTSPNSWKKVSSVEAPDLVFKLVTAGGPPNVKPKDDSERLSTGTTIDWKASPTGILRATLCLLESSNNDHARELTSLSAGISVLPSLMVHGARPPCRKDIGTKPLGGKHKASRVLQFEAGASTQRPPRTSKSRVHMHRQLHKWVRTISRSGPSRAHASREARPHCTHSKILEKSKWLRTHLERLSSAGKSTAPQQDDLQGSDLLPCHVAAHLRHPLDTHEHDV